MSVQNLDNREKGLNLQERAAQQAENDARNSAKVKAAAERTKRGGTGDAELEERIAAAREMVPPEADRHCTDCVQAWIKGRDAALKAIEG